MEAQTATVVIKITYLPRPLAPGVVLVKMEPRAVYRQHRRYKVVMVAPQVLQVLQVLQAGFRVAVVALLMATVMAVLVGRDRTTRLREHRLLMVVVVVVLQAVPLIVPELGVLAVAVQALFLVFLLRAEQVILVVAVVDRGMREQGVMVALALRLSPALHLQH